MRCHHRSHHERALGFVHARRDAASDHRLLALAMFDAIDAHPWVGSALTAAPGSRPWCALSNGLASRFRPLVSRKKHWVTVSTLLNYILGVGGRNAANGSSLGCEASTDPTSWRRCRLRGRNSIRRVSVRTKPGRAVAHSRRPEGFSRRDRSHPQRIGSPHYEQGRIGLVRKNAFPSTNSRTSWRVAFRRVRLVVSQDPVCRMFAPSYAKPISTAGMNMTAFSAYSAVNKKLC